MDVAENKSSHFGQKPETHLKLSTPVAISKSAQFAILGKLNKYCAQNRYLEFVATIIND